MSGSKRFCGTARRVLALVVVVAGVSCSTAGGSGGPPAPAGPGKTPLALTYVANAGVLVAAGESKVLIDGKVGSVAIEALRTLHSGDRESPMNLMYLLELDGWRVFHEGDSAGKVDDSQRFGLGSAPVDLALVHFWFPLEPSCARFLQETLKPARIALTHLPIRLEGDAPGKIEMVRKYYADVLF